MIRDPRWPGSWAWSRRFNPSRDDQGPDLMTFAREDIERFNPSRDDQGPGPPANGGCPATQFQSLQG